MLAALRPVWLMSPTAVSDALPLDPGLFDVVVCDDQGAVRGNTDVGGEHVQDGDQLVLSDVSV